MNLRHDQTDEGWVVFFTFPSSSLSVFRCVSPRGRDEDDDLTGEDVLRNHFKWSVPSLSLFGCVFQKLIEGKIRV